jgi:hypothetical protein
LSSYAALNLNNRRYIAYRPCPELQGQDQIASIAVATTLLTGASNFVFTASDSGVWLLPYVALFPTLLLLVTMRLMTSHRAAIGGTAAYILVGIEQELGVIGFESVFREARRLSPGQEANDPMLMHFTY